MELRCLQPRKIDRRGARGWISTTRVSWHAWSLICTKWKITRRCWERGNAWLMISMVARRFWFWPGGTTARTSRSRRCRGSWTWTVTFDLQGRGWTCRVCWARWILACSVPLPKVVRMEFWKACRQGWLSPERTSTRSGRWLARAVPSSWRHRTITKRWPVRY